MRPTAQPLQAPPANSVAITEDQIESCLHRCYRSDFCLMSMKAGSRFTFFGQFHIQVLYGCVVSHGYEFSAGAYHHNRFIPIAAPYSLGPPTQILVEECSKPYNAHRLKWRLKEVADLDDVILNSFDGKDAVVLFCFSMSNAAEYIREIFQNTFFVPGNSKFCYFLDPLCCIVTVGYPLLFDGINVDHIISLKNVIMDKIEEKKRSITMVIGAKNCGKSMLTRVLLNFCLKKKEVPIYFLDCDVGQSETNPSGCVSLMKVETPFLSVPILSQRMSFSHSYFFGGNTPNSDIDLYLSLIHKLYDHFNTETPDNSVLIVNTLGWIDGKGARILNNLVKLFAPTAIYNFGTSERTFLFSEYLMRETPHTIIFSGEGIKRPEHLSYLRYTVNAPTHRSLLLASYMASVYPSSSLKSFADAVPYAIEFRNVYLHLRIDVEYPIEHIFTLLNCTTVALCSIDPVVLRSIKVNRLFDDVQMPVMLDTSVSPLRVHGFGFIRAIDPVHHKFYVVTPLKGQALANVNVFAKGHHNELPEFFLLAQKTPSVPYVVREMSSTIYDDLFKQLNVLTAHKRHNQFKEQEAFPNF